MNYSRNNNRGGRFDRRKKFDRPKRAPLPEGFSLFYIAISCPENINEKIEGMKNYMEEQYGCRAARKSPAHLTVIPPFRAEDELQPTLLNFITTFNIGLVPFDVTLKGYGQFAERVLYVDVQAPNENLIQLEKECMNEFSEQFPGIIFGMKPEFNPHVTIATRDIPEGAIRGARSYFEQNHPIDDSFPVNSLSLYRLEDGWWKQVII
jgi:2'-5' RNA ligase